MRTLLVLCAMGAATIVAEVGYPFTEPPASLEYKVKAAFLVNFAKFVRWPDEAFTNASAPIVFGVIGGDPFGDAFEPFAGKTVAGRKFVIRRVHSTDEAASCQVLFLPRTAAVSEEILKKMDGLPVLTVTDREERVPGAIITMFVQDNRIAFSVDNGLAKKAGLSISSKLLNLARNVVN